MIDPEKTKAFMEGIWDREIIPALTDYIRIPNKSPAFDPDWEKNGHMAQVVEMFSVWAREKLKAFPGAAQKNKQQTKQTPQKHQQTRTKQTTHCSGGGRRFIFMFM